jgi:hypothetical protein
MLEELNKTTLIVMPSTVAVISMAFLAIDCIRKLGVF